MDCFNHPGLDASGRCTGCAEPFCGNCLVSIAGQSYCGSCKMMTVKNVPQVADVVGVWAPATQCKEATTALVMAIVSILCVGFITAPIAIIFGFISRNQLDKRPNIQGTGMAVAAIIIACGVAAVWFFIGVHAVTGF